MRTQATIRLIVCDSCKVREVIGDADDPMLGTGKEEDVPDGWFVGTVLDPNSRESLEWSACKASHIKGAVLGAMEF